MSELVLASMQDSPAPSHLGELASLSGEVVGLPNIEPSRDYFITPVDELTGLPACFAPKYGLPPVPGPRDRNIDRPADWNHMFPKFEVMRNRHAEFGRLGRLALMNLRAQWVDWSQHHDVYNEQFVGPRQPITHSQLARTLLFGLAGEVPEVAIDLNGFSPRQIGLTLKQRRDLWESGQIKVISHSDVRKYLFEYVMRQDVDHIRRKELMEFLREDNMEKRIYQAHCLAAKIVERAVEPFEPDYVEFRQQSALGEELPAHPRDFLKRSLLPGSSTGRLIHALQRKLGAYRREQQIDLPEPLAA